jgi:hypothetical protein
MAILKVWRHSGQRSQVVDQDGGIAMVGKARATRVTGEARADLTREVVSRYEAGESIRELAASLDRSYGFVHRLLSEAGVGLRGRGGATRNRAARLAAG